MSPIKRRVFVIRCGFSADLQCADHLSQSDIDICLVLEPGKLLGDMESGGTQVLCQSLADADGGDGQTHTA